jgi:uncharacterized protein YjbJ (UPF0337 family)
MADESKGRKAEGTWDKVKGRAQEAWGAATGSEEDRLKGQGKQVKGETKKTTEEIKDKFR